LPIMLIRKPKHRIVVNTLGLKHGLNVLTTFSAYDNIKIYFLGNALIG